MVYFNIVYGLFYVAVATGMYSSKEMEGHPLGYLSDCPGSEKPAEISRKSLRYLSMRVQGPGPGLTAKKTMYPYGYMKELAKDPEIDFKRKKTLLYVGGYLDSSSFPIGWVLGTHYKNLNYNVLLLETNRFTTYDYPVAARLMRPVGFHTAEMLVNLTRYGLDPKRLELVGLSLGGQTISFIAKSFRELTGTNISRITGLDPSGPCFRHLGPEYRLDQSDADFVDIISTNVDGFGMAAPVGHVNFFVNGGEFQPGDVLWLPCNVLCSHVRSYLLWLSALDNPDSFIAMQCDSVEQAREKKCFDKQPLVTNVVGLKTDKRKEGIFYLATSGNYPYYLGKKGLKRENDVFAVWLKRINRNEIMKM